jgi:hypothetical protein
VATTSVGGVGAKNISGGPLGGGAEAQEHPPPYAEDAYDGTGPLRGDPDSVCCANMHWFLQGIT